VRHALNPYTLLLANKASPNPKYVESAKRGIGFTMRFMKHEGKRCYIWHKDVPAKYENAKMGTVAVTILSILKLGDVANIDEYRDTLSCLGEEILFMQDPNGFIRQYDVPRDHPYYGSANSIFPGELCFALARIYRFTKDQRYKDAFDRGMDFYRKWWDVNVKHITQDGIYNEEDRVNLVGFVPWFVMALNEMHLQTSDAKYSDWALHLQDWMDDMFLFDTRNSQYADYVGSYFKSHRELPAINSCGYTEGAAAAYAIAKRVGRDLDKRRLAVVLGVRYALQVQYDSYDSSYYLVDPAIALGGFRYHLGTTRLRNDYSYHAMSALAQSVEFLEPEDYPASKPIRIPATMAQLSRKYDNETTAEEPVKAGKAAVLPKSKKAPEAVPAPPAVEIKTPPPKPSASPKGEDGENAKESAPED